MSIEGLRAKKEKQLTELRRLKGDISTMKRDAYFNGRYADPLTYHKAVIEHGNAHKKMLDTEAEIAKHKRQDQPFNVRFIRAAREILPQSQMTEIEKRAEDMADA